MLWTFGAGRSSAGVKGTDLHGNGLLNSPRSSYLQFVFFILGPEFDSDTLEPPQTPSPPPNFIPTCWPVFKCQSTQHRLASVHNDLRKLRAKGLVEKLPNHPAIVSAHRAIPFAWCSSNSSNAFIHHSALACFKVHSHTEAMCGRYQATTPEEEIAPQFNLPHRDHPRSGSIIEGATSGVPFPAEGAGAAVRQVRHLARRTKMSIPLHHDPMRQSSGRINHLCCSQCRQRQLIRKCR
jgi:hypothetical protein